MLQHKRNERWEPSADQLRQSIKERTLQILGGSLEFPTDHRLRYLLDNIECNQLTAVEFGSWHGWHTATLSRKFRHVIAVDARPTNVAFALLRLKLLGINNVDVVLSDVQSFEFNCDVLVHIGVLYHLSFPIKHLYHVLPKCHTICLDTHIGDEDRPHLTPSYEVYNDEIYYGKNFPDGDWDDALSGVCGTSFWPNLAEIHRVLNNLRFKILHEHRHMVDPGPRVTIVASKRCGRILM